MQKPSVITIDGPAASGKSTLGERLARQLDYTYFDTGVLYRALTYLAIQHQVSFDDIPRLVQLARHMNPQIQPPTVADGRQYTILLDNQDVTWAIREPAIERSVSTVSRHPEVRAALREQQRAIGRRGHVVMVGRDIGGVVMPDADFKIFLDASPEERARRRHSELLAKGRETSYDDVLRDLRNRDALDQQNTFQPEGSYIIHSDDRTPEAIVAELLGVLDRRRYT